MNIDILATILIVTVAYFLLIERRLSRVEKDIAVLRNTLKILTKSIEKLDYDNEHH